MATRSQEDMAGGGNPPCAHCRQPIVGPPWWVLHARQTELAAADKAPVLTAIGRTPAPGAEPWCSECLRSVAWT